MTQLERHKYVTIYIKCNGFSKTLIVENTFSTNYIKFTFITRAGKKVRGLTTSYYKYKFLGFKMRFLNHKLQITEIDKIEMQEMHNSEFSLLSS